MRGLLKNIWTSEASRPRVTAVSRLAVTAAATIAMTVISVPILVADGSPSGKPIQQPGSWRTSWRRPHAELVVLGDPPQGFGIARPRKHSGSALGATGLRLDGDANRLMFLQR
jgi:hypothetical protein